MHSTRVATFLLGAWIGCCILMDLLAVQNLRLAGRFMNAAIAPAASIIQAAGRADAALLIRHFAAEQYRYYFNMWGLAQIPVALVLAGILYLAAEKRMLPIVLCGLMLVFVIFQLAILPELGYRGRQADFPPGSETLGVVARVLALIEIYIGAEIAKLLVGGILAAYVFVYKSRRRLRRDDELSDIDRIAAPPLNRTPSTGI
jgi:hypothetical protein